MDATIDLPQTITTDLERQYMVTDWIYMIARFVHLSINLGRLTEGWRQRRNVKYLLSVWTLVSGNLTAKSAQGLDS